MLYHVVGPKWHPGHDLESWETLVERGVLSDADWHWPDVDIGWDGNLVCLHRTIDDARDYVAEYGGRIVAVDDEALCEAGFRVIYNAEGYPCVAHYIPSDMVSEVEEHHAGSNQHARY
jgi:hypothetical protein